MLKKEDGNTQLLSNTVRGKYYHSLNGFRGISIILVVCYHLHIFRGAITNQIFNGRLGVGVFFVLSGFLITTLCLKEQELTGKLSLRSFYTRRALRIFPVGYLYLLVIVVVNHIYTLGIPAFQFMGAAGYVLNFSYFRSHHFTYIIAHYWTLSVEEQFYLIFPVILKFSKKAFTCIVLSIVFMLPVIYAVQELVPAINHGLPYYLVHYFIKFQCIAVGCLFALLAFDGFLDGRWLKSSKIIGNIIALFFIFYLDFQDFYTVKTAIINAAISILIAYVIVSNLQNSRDWIFRFLNTKVLSFIGILSYSIYIWHMLFASFDSKLPPVFSQIPYNIPGIIIIPLLSYYFFEKYFLKLKSRFSRVK